MPNDPSEPSNGGYKISDSPVTSSSGSWPRAESRDELSELSSHFGQPLLVAIARDPQTLFVCWSVDWFAVFENVLPADRCAHVRLRQNGNQKTVAVEPMSGGCVIDDLEPGETYGVELGYYAPAETWNSVVVGNEVMMPFLSEPGDALVAVATIPIHLSFQQMLKVLSGADSGDLVQRLAQFQERTTTKKLTGEQSEILRGLYLSAEDLEKTAAARESLEKSARVSAPSAFVGGSPTEGFGGASLRGERRTIDATQ